MTRVLAARPNSLFVAFIALFQDGVGHCPRLWSRERFQFRAQTNRILIPAMLTDLGK
jgi:hypothetical protein